MRAAPASSKSCRISSRCRSVCVGVRVCSCVCVCVCVCVGVLGGRVGKCGIQQLTHTTTPTHLPNTHTHTCAHHTHTHITHTRTHTHPQLSPNGGDPMNAVASASNTAVMVNDHENIVALLDTIQQASFRHKRRSTRQEHTAT